MTEDWAEFMDFVESPAGEKVRDEAREDAEQAHADALTANDVLAEVLRWRELTDEAALTEAITNLLSLIVRRKEPSCSALYRALSDAVTDDLKEIVEAQWARLKPQNSADTATNEFIHFGENSLIAAINSKTAVVRRGGSMEFAFWDADGSIHFSKRRDAEIALAQYRLVVETKNEGMKELDGFPIWIRSPSRRECKGVGFYPDGKAPEGYLNLWSGCSVQPASGDWSLMRAHMHENICRGNKEHFEYLLDLLSQLFNEPWRKSEVITAIKGKPGVGKSKVGEWVCAIIGPRHSIVIEKGQHITGNFNGHLEPKIFVQAEEAVFSGDRAAAKALLHLATSHRFLYENKGQDARDGKNFTRVFMTTNEDWVAPIDADDRRYFVLHCSDAHMQDRPYFAAIDEQMQNGGAAAMLHDLLARGMTFARLGRPPVTDAKREQIRHSMSQQMKWLASVLTDGHFLYREHGTTSSAEWPERGGAVSKEDVLLSYRDFVPGYRSPPTAEELGLFLGKVLPGLKSSKPTVLGKRTPHYVLPSLEAARAEFLCANPGYVFEMDAGEIDGTGHIPANDPGSAREKAS